MIKWTAVLLGLVLAQLSGAQTYRWVDENGVLQFSDKPPRSEQQYEPMEMREIATIKTVTVESMPRREAPRRTRRRTSVVLYSTDWCPYCEQARRHFASRGIRYREHDVEKSERGRRRYRELGGTGVPVIVIGNRVMRGFSASAFDEAYAASLERG